MKSDLILLYVEDEKSIREEMLDILELDFNTVHVAINGQEGLSMYKEFHPDIIISDIQMPIMDGISMSKEILSIDKHAKIIFISAFNEKRYLEQTKEIGIENYLNKPVDIKELFKKIESIIH